MKSMMPMGDEKASAAKADREKCTCCRGASTIKSEKLLDASGQPKDIICPLCRGSGKNLNVIAK